ncbi:MAG: glutamate racemase [Motiliproteus sp.]
MTAPITTSAPIGIFDSGVGGLSIAHAIRRRLPAEQLLYVADQAFAPYGVQSAALIKQRAATVLQFLTGQGCKAIVIACNTATVHSIAELRQQNQCPIVGVEPGIKPAALNSRNGTIGVLATAQTLSSSSYQQLLTYYSPQTQIHSVACPAFVELVETGNLNSDTTRKTIDRYLRPLLSSGVDQIVLGCTHFSFLKTAIHDYLDGRAALIDTATAVAAQLQRQLTASDTLNDSDGQPEDSRTIRFISSDCTEAAALSIGRLWGEPVCVDPFSTFNTEAEDRPETVPE